MGAQRPHHVPAVGPLARRELELRAVGALPRPAAARDAGARAMRRLPGRARRTLAARPADRRDVRADEHRLAAVPGDRARRDRARSDALALRRERSRSPDRAVSVPAGVRLLGAAVGPEPLGRGRTRRRRRSRSDRGALAPWPRLVLQGVACGLALRRDPRPPQPHVARLHLLSVLARSPAHVSFRRRRTASAPRRQGTRRTRRVSTAGSN